MPIGDGCRGTGAGRIAEMGSGVDVSAAGGGLPVRIVLVETTHPGNIGAAARAMKNMSLDRLWLVNPETFPHAEATARASGAADVLHLRDAGRGAGGLRIRGRRERATAIPAVAAAGAAGLRTQDCRGVRERGSRPGIRPGEVGAAE